MKAPGQDEENDNHSVTSSIHERNAVSDDESTSTEEITASSSSGLNTNEFHNGIAANETKNVNKLKILVIFVLAFFAVFSAVLTYYYTRRVEREDFYNSFSDFATELLEALHHNAGNIWSAVNSLGIATTSLSIFADLEWPFVSIPHFEMRAEQAMQNSGIDFLAFSPLVPQDERSSWEAFTNQEWIGQEGQTNRSDSTAIPSIPLKIFGAPNYNASYDSVPVWQTSPASDPSIVNFDLQSNQVFHDVVEFALRTKAPALSRIIDVSSLFGDSVPDSDGHPESLIINPIFRDFSESNHEKSDVVGLIIGMMPWKILTSNLLHYGAHGVIAVVHNSCGDIFSYRIDGPVPTFLGEGDHHDPSFDSHLHVGDFEPFDWHGEATDHSTVDCHFRCFMYPSKALEDDFLTHMPITSTIAVLLVFLVTTLVFLAYDCLVDKRQTKVMETAIRSDAIVSSLFPRQFRDRLLMNNQNGQNSTVDRKLDQQKKTMAALITRLGDNPKNHMKSFLAVDDRSGKNLKDDSDSNDDIEMSKPIADLFPAATVMFADIAGFTAWSSTREPAHVFTLLETLYNTFDKSAKRLRVFKVETIGDCYVAVAGLPEPREDHAIVMARFARNCLDKMDNVLKQMEVILGPDTGDLGIRFGLHSGAVTAGILRGEKSRFQLFGDTVNTASRMESTGAKNRIQISEATAALLELAGKDHWTQPRDTTVSVKGKGEMNTFWLFPKTQEGSTSSGNPSTNKLNDLMDHSSTGSLDGGSTHGSLRAGRPSTAKSIKTTKKKERMMNWIVDVLLRFLKQIVAARDAKKKSATCDEKGLKQLEQTRGRSSTVQDEVTEFVSLPLFENQDASVLDPSKVKLSPQVETELRNFVSLIASMYNPNCFHNFEHASHVTMSVCKLLSRIVAPELSPDDKAQGHVKILSSMHDRTYGITSDPLTQFAAVFSALVHDVDHSGVPNTILVKENEKLSSMYKGKSVAEQNSVDVAWDALMREDFYHLRRCIYTTIDEFKRFRQLVVNTVMATDILDKELAGLRRNRWDRCFNRSKSDLSSTATHCDDVHRKAAIVMEHLIQASDVAHTMQHWDVYRKWNEMLFHEMYRAYRAGRSDKDPSINWYESEIGFFDNYIIPLAKKLKQCGVFGVSSDEYLNYARENRQEWYMRGRSVVEDMKRKALQEIANDKSTLET